MLRRPLHLLSFSRFRTISCVRILQLYPRTPTRAAKQPEKDGKRFRCVHVCFLRAAVSLSVRAGKHAQRMTLKAISGNRFFRRQAAGESPAASRGAAKRGSFPSRKSPPNGNTRSAGIFMVFLLKNFSSNRDLP